MVYLGCWSPQPVQVAQDNGARRVLIPTENRRHFLEVPGEVVDWVDPIFYSDPLTAVPGRIGLPR